VVSRRAGPTLERDRFRGCLLGLAVGDAIGTTVEFKPPGTFPPVTDMVGGGPFDLPAGAWTDDTSMAMCLAESLIACGGSIRSTS
jgi:ADP-ribosyl-[dinitrogen reductase] hydrolase